MARWRLGQKHYLNVPGTEWEYKENNRTKNGRVIRKVFAVPRHLDPDDPSDWTEADPLNDGGFINVCHAGKGLEADIVFEGQPTPDMVPLDDEAKAISAELAKGWQHPIESLPGTFSQSLLTELERKMIDLQADNATPAKVEVTGMSELMTVMGAMMKQNQELIATLAANPKRV